MSFFLSLVGKDECILSLTLKDGVLVSSSNAFETEEEHSCQPRACFWEWTADLNSSDYSC